VSCHFASPREQREKHLHEALRARAIAAEAPNDSVRGRYLKLEVVELTLWGLWGYGMLEATQTARNYQKRARELRKQAYDMPDADGIILLLSIADDDELLAMHAGSVIPVLEDARPNPCPVPP
jgi:hypothetical protein